MDLEGRHWHSGGYPASREISFGRVGSGDGREPDLKI